MKKLNEYHCRNALNITDYFSGSTNFSFSLLIFSSKYYTSIAGTNPRKLVFSYFSAINLVDVFEILYLFYLLIQLQTLGIYFYYFFVLFYLPILA